MGGARNRARWEEMMEDALTHQVDWGEGRKVEGCHRHSTEPQNAGIISPLLQCTRLLLSSDICASCGERAKWGVQAPTKCSKYQQWMSSTDIPKPDRTYYYVGKGEGQMQQMPTMNVINLHSDRTLCKQPKPGTTQLTQGWHNTHSWHSWVAEESHLHSILKHTHPVLAM